MSIKPSFAGRAGLPFRSTGPEDEFRPATSVLFYVHLKTLLLNTCRNSIFARVIPTVPYMQTCFDVVGYDMVF